MTESRAGTASSPVRLTNACHCRTRSGFEANSFVSATAGSPTLRGHAPSEATPLPRPAPTDASSLRGHTTDQPPRPTTERPKAGAKRMRGSKTPRPIHGTH